MSNDVATTETTATILIQLGGSMMKTTIQTGMTNECQRADEHGAHEATALNAVSVVDHGNDRAARDHE
jgi:hypothetical protein